MTEYEVSVRMFEMYSVESDSVGEAMSKTEKMCSHRGATAYRVVDVSDV